MYIVEIVYDNYYASYFFKSNKKIRKGTYYMPDYQSKVEVIDCYAGKNKYATKEIKKLLCLLLLKK